MAIYVLFNGKIIKHKMKKTQSKKHKFGTYETAKISLSCFDDKRYMLDNDLFLWLIFIKIVSRVNNCNHSKIL